MNINLNIRPYFSKPGEGQLLIMSGARLRVGSAQNNGTFELLEIKGSPMPHVHREHDECFYIIEGSYTFTLGTEQVVAPADSVIFVPRGTRHTFTRSEGARALVFVIPAQLEGFFRELGEGLAAGRPEADLRTELAGKYDSWPVK